MERLAQELAGEEVEAEEHGYGGAAEDALDDGHVDGVGEGGREEGENSVRGRDGGDWAIMEVVGMNYRVEYW